MMIAQRIRFLLLLHKIMHSVLKTVAIFSHFIKLLKSVNSTFTLAVRSQKFGQAKTHFLSLCLHNKYLKGFLFESHQITISLQCLFKALPDKNQLQYGLGTFKCLFKGQTLNYQGEPFKKSVSTCEITMKIKSECVITDDFDWPLSPGCFSEIFWKKLKYEKKLQRSNVFSLFQASIVPNVTTLRTQIAN